LTRLNADLVLGHREGRLVSTTWVLATLALIVIVAVSVVIDLPRPITKSQDAPHRMLRSRR